MAKSRGQTEWPTQKMARKAKEHGTLSDDFKASQKKDKTKPVGKKMSDTAAKKFAAGAKKRGK